MPISVRVRLWGHLRRAHPGGDASASIEMQLPEGATAGDVMQRLNLSPEVQAALLISRGEELLGPDHALREGDRINLAPPAAGGMG